MKEQMRCTVDEYAMLVDTLKAIKKLGCGCDAVPVEKDAEADLCPGCLAAGALLSVGVENE